MMRPVTRAFSTNDREKHDSTNERYSSYAACHESPWTLGNSARLITEIARETFKLALIPIEILQIRT